MAEINPNRLMSFDRGIDNIVFAGREDHAAHELPERRNLTPSDDNVRPQLSQLLVKPNTDRFLEEASSLRRWQAARCWGLRCQEFSHRHKRHGDRRSLVTRWNAWALVRSACVIRGA